VTRPLIARSGRGQPIDLAVTVQLAQHDLLDPG
jgi:hypothetical protein